MRIRDYDVLDGIDSANDHAEGTIIVFGEGLPAIQVYVDDYGRLRISATDGKLIIEPQASNSVVVRADRF